MSFGWVVRGLCREVDPEVFFPSPGRSAEPAKRVCARCPVSEECLAWSLEGEFPLEGVWAGLTKQQRSRFGHGGTPANVEELPTSAGVRTESAGSPQNVHPRVPMNPMQ